MGPDKNTANLFSGTAQDIVIFYINCELSDDSMAISFDFSFSKEVFFFKKFNLPF